MKGGAHDYIMKDRLARLVPAVERELREATIRAAQRLSEAELRRAHDELEMRVEQRTADLKSTNQKLRDVLEERRRLENELLDIAENERRRIGLDLHDDLGQKLTGVLLMIKGLELRLSHERHVAAGEAEKIRELIEQVMQHTHNIARQCSSLDVTGDGLCEVLKVLSTNVEKMFGIPCTLAFRGEIPSLAANTSLQLHKIAQEAISNAIKHGKATRVAISVHRNSDKLVLAVKNDGVPFSVPETKKNRMGLRIMNYRANTVGASIEIKPNQKNGTIVTCTLPMKNGSRPNREDSQRTTKGSFHRTAEIADEVRVHATA
jgi:signal transduction histidine kinase